MSSLLPDDQLKRLRRLVASPKKPSPVAPLPDPEAAAAGMLGKYRLKKQLGTRAWEAINTETNRHVVLRILGPITEKVIIDRLGADLKALANLSHPIFIPYIKMSQCEGTYFVVRPWQDGVNLESCELAPEGGLQAFYQIARALQFAHGRGLHHGGLHPRNVIVDSSGRPYIVDFHFKRLSRYVKNDSMASAGPESDIADLGVLFLALLSGKPYAEMAVATAPPPLRTVAPEIDKELEHMAARILGTDPFTNITDMADEAGRIYQLIPTEQLPEMGLLQKFRQKKGQSS